MSATESKQFSSISSTTAQFQLHGGKYALIASATWNSGSLQLEVLSLDGTTWINVGSALSANGFATFDLPPGQYRLAVASATALYASLTTIPGEV